LQGFCGTLAWTARSYVGCCPEGPSTLDGTAVGSVTVMSEQFVTVSHESQPVNWLAVRGHHCGRSAVSLDDKFVVVGGAVEGLEAQVVDDGQVQFLGKLEARTSGRSCEET
jgi:hypothetical protein